MFKVAPMSKCNMVKPARVFESIIKLNRSYFVISSPKQLDEDKFFFPIGPSEKRIDKKKKITGGKISYLQKKVS